VTATENVETADTSTDEMAGVARDEPAAAPTAEITLIDEFAEPEPTPVSTAVVQPPAVDDEQRAQSGEAAAEFARTDVSAEPAAQPQPSRHAVDETPAETAMHPPQSAADNGEATTPSDQVSPHLHDIAAGPRRHPLRFTWQIDADDRFSVVSDDFIRLIGPDTAAGLDRPWSEIASRFTRESAGRIANALATRHTWSAVAVDWPVDGGGRLPVELSGLPVYDRLREFAGYRGFGVCRDLDALTELAALRCAEAEKQRPEPAPAPAIQAEPTQSSHGLAAVPPMERTQDSALKPDDSEKPVEPPGNVVPTGQISTA